MSQLECKEAIRRVNEINYNLYTSPQRSSAAKTATERQTEERLIRREIFFDTL